MAQFELEYDTKDHETDLPMGNRRLQWIEAIDDDDAVNKLHNLRNLTSEEWTIWLRVTRVVVTTKEEND